MLSDSFVYFFYSFVLNMFNKFYALTELPNESPSLVTETAIKVFFTHFDILFLYMVDGQQVFIGYFSFASYFLTCTRVSFSLSLNIEDFYNTSRSFKVTSILFVT